MNTQPISKQDLRKDGALWVHSIFYTIQGEGPFAGTPAVFVRLQGCNLQCPGCDTEYTAPIPNKLQESPQSVRDITNAVMASADLRSGNHPLVVITGGEPFRQNIHPFVLDLLRFGFFVQIETNGTLPVEFACNTDINHRSGVFIVCSPKTPRVHSSIEANACAFKYVLSHDSMALDGLPVEVLHNHIPTKVYRPKRSVPIYLQPMDHSQNLPKDWSTVGQQIILRENNYKSLEAVKASCLRYGYILQLQLHKIIGVE
jgi:7-carboxy-7-deazaguanine synthase